MTFVKFLNEYIIEIPRIQRDYVQGRVVTTEQKEKRSDFVGNLIGALSDGGRPCVLDFVYGYPTGDGAVRTFIPLDGQQRLTSLYLLHWYFLHLVAEKQPDEESIFDADGTKMQKLNGKFKYNNRISSTEFCQRLTSRSAFIKIDGETAIRKIIMQQPWFDEEWINDPTIESMLDMLTEFETTLKNKEYRELADMAEKLFSEDHECIYFDTLSLKDLKQGESLYVKMNARGKKLTRFENWKAKFTKMLDDVHKDEEFNYGDISRCNSLKYKDYFCYSIEHDWNDLFWHFVTKDIKWDNVEDVMNNPYPTVDRAFSNFLCFVHQILYFYDRNDAKAKTSDFQWTFAQNEETYGNGKVSNLEFLFQCLDFLSHIDNSYTNGRGKGMGAFFDDIFYNKNNNCDTPSVGHKVRIAGDISNLYEKAIGYYTDDKKKKVVNNLEDSSKFNLTEMYLLWAILKYCAPKYCSNRQSNYAVDDQLRYYVRDCRNRLDAFDQFLTDKVTMSPNLRLVDANIIIGKMPTQLFSKARYADTPLQDLYEWLDDFDYLYEGNVNSNHAYLPILNKIESKQTQITVQQVRDFVTAFEKRTTLDKIRLLISVGYKGKTGIGTTGGNRERYLFGQKNRWSVFFVEDAAVLSPLLEQLIKDYSGCQDIQTQIDNYKQSTAVNTFAYYIISVH